MDLKWQLALLSIRARRYFQRTGKKIAINRSDTTGYDKSKVECFNCHKMGHFARECRGPRNQDNRNMNQDSSRRTVNVEETSSKAMVAIDGAGFDWRFMADEEVPTNMALMDFSDSEFNKSEFNLATYKRGLTSIEEQLVFYKKNEVIFCDQIAVLKRDTSFKDLEINVLKSSQISDNSRKGVGFVSYNVVPPPPIGLFAPPTIDLSNSDLEEFQQPEFKGYGPKTNNSVCKDTSNEVKKTPDAPLGEKLVSEKEKQNVFPTNIESVHPQKEDQGYVDSGCSRHMTDNMSYLTDFKEFDEGYVTFGGGAKGGRITVLIWIFRNKKDERRIVIRNIARLVVQGYTQEEGIDYDEVFAHLARIEAIRLFLAYASFMEFMMSSMGELNLFLGLQVKQREDGIFISQDKYVAEILKKFGFTDVKTTSNLMDTKKPLLKDSDGDDVDVHIYKSMIRSLMYLTSSRLDIMFAVCACARFQVTPKVSHSHDLVAYSDSDYTGAS
ncbi:ribonuclease H-like domain-containing protein [Tanacetum coccineum]